MPKIWCHGSINIDWVYTVPRVVPAGQTLAAVALDRFLGGKGANQSVAAARAGATVSHIGAVGQDGRWALDIMAGFGVDVSDVVMCSAPTGHAIIQVDEAGENAIVIHAGANAHIPPFSHGQPGDWLMLQNETTGSVPAARAARAAGIKVIYSAAPFDPAAVRAILPHVDFLLLNEHEDAALQSCIGPIDVARVVTRGARGADWFEGARASPLSIPAYEPGHAVDTTGAGDCLAGYFVAGLSCDLPPDRALRRAVAAAGLQVMKQGAAGAIPSADQVDRLICSGGAHVN